MNGPKNITLGLFVIFYYLINLCLRQIIPFVPRFIQYWTIALLFWMICAVILRNLTFLITQIIALLGYGLVMSATGDHTHAWGVEVFHLLTLPLKMILFVVFPALFFIATFEPFELVKDLSILRLRRAPPYLLLICCVGAMFANRFNDVVEHFRARGVDIRTRYKRLVTLHIFLPPLLWALIQEAAYREQYAKMLGCEAGAVPLLKSRIRLSNFQKFFVTLALLLFAVIIFFRVRS